MSTRGQKRTEEVDNVLPADKRACNSLESRPSTSSSSPRSSAHEGQDTDMDAVSNHSESDGEGERDSDGEAEGDALYGSCDSNYREYYRQRESNDHIRFRTVLASLSGELNDSEQLIQLTELCELLSFCSGNSLSDHMTDKYIPILVKLAMHEDSADIVLLSIRAMTYLCDVNSQTSAYLVRHDAISVLCQKLMVIEYLDLAEQCMQALQKISHEQPRACLHSGAITAVLTYIDFFSTSVQRVALSTVVNICKKLSSESPSLFMDAVPILCNLLQYEDKPLVESVATCLISIGNEVCHSSDMLDEICKHGLVQQTLHLVGTNGRTTLCQPTYIGLIGLLAKLASGSTLAYKTLFQLGISTAVKDMLSTYHLSHGTHSSSTVEGHHSQIQVILKLLNGLLPTITAEQEGQLKSDKETFLLNHPDILQKFGVDLLPILIQVVDSGINLSICYCALSVINKLVHFSQEDSLHSLLVTANFSSFLAGVFARKDRHVIQSALQIVDVIMLKLPDVFLNSFIKEGVTFAIHSQVAPDDDSKLSPVFDGMHLENDRRSAGRCPCFAFDMSQSSKSRDDMTCKISKEAVQVLATRIWTSYFEAESMNPEKGVTDALQRLRVLASSLAAIADKPPKDSFSRHEEEEINDLLHQIVSKLKEKDSISTFEFVESGIITALVHYLAGGSHLVGEKSNVASNNLEKRFEAFGLLLLSRADSSCEEFPILTLLRRLQSALSSVENFPIIPSYAPKMRGSYATVPFGRSTTYTCLKVQFLKENGDNSLCDFADDFVNVDPFSPLDDIEEYLWSRVSNVKNINLNVNPTDSTAKEKNVGSAEDFIEQVKDGPLEASGDVIMDHQEGKNIEDTKPRLQFYLEEQQLNNQLTLYQSMIEKQIEVENYNIKSSTLWTRTYTITYKRHVTTQSSSSDAPVSKPYLKKLGLIHDILFLLKSLEEINRLRFHFTSRERTHAYAEERTDDLDKLNVPIYEVSQTEFVNSKLTEKLEQQLRDPMTVSVGGMPAWCTQLMAYCPFLFGFEARYNFFHLAALDRLPNQMQTSPRSNAGSPRSNGNALRKKFLVHRDKILESAAEMMEVPFREKVFEVEYTDEVGTGLGPTLEFYTLVCREFQKRSLGMWRDNHDFETESFLVSPFGLFPRPWSPSMDTSAKYREVIEKFVLLGKMVAKALQDGRILDLPFSKAFFKLILGKELDVIDIQSIDPGFGRTLLELQAVVERKKYLGGLCEEKCSNTDVCFRSSTIEDLCLDFTLPGYPDYIDDSACNAKMVCLDNLAEYIMLMVDATIKSGINQQVEAFKSGFDEVFSIRHLKVFTEEELEQLMCGDHVQWNSDELVDHVKFDHGYTVSSPQIVNLLEIMEEFDREQQRAFLQFVTGAPRLPLGGLASLNPKLTIVRKHCGNFIDADLPSVMTCANYLKLPPYSSKDVMKEKLIYAITEGQGSFHLS